MLGDTLGNTNNQGDLSLNGLLNTTSGHGRAMFPSCQPYNILNRNPMVVCTSRARLCIWVCMWVCMCALRDEDSCGGRASLLDGIGDSGEDGEIEMCRAGLLRVCSSNDLGACEPLCIRTIFSYSNIPLLSPCAR